jgi:hypothetical protein
MPDLPPQELAVVALVVLLLLWAGVDAALRSERAYRAAGRRKPVWLAVALLVPTLGPLLYLLVVRRRLRAAAWVS